MKALSLLADFANGLFALIAASYLTSHALQWWYLLIGMPLALLPDIDAVPELLQRGRVSASAEHPTDHRTFLHYPILPLVLGVGAMYWLGFWGLVVFIAVMLHLVNDLYGTGWGLPLLWPFTDRHYKLCARRVNRRKRLLIEGGEWDTLPNEERRLRFVVSWSAAELKTYIPRWGIDDWIPKYYFRLNWVAGLEYSLFVVACIWFVWLL